MRRKITAFALALGAFATLALASSASADVKISDREPYVRYDGAAGVPGTNIPDPTIASCSDNNPVGTIPGGNRQQNEPTAAVDPRGTGKMTAGANDYCPVPTSGDSWAGFYYSSDGTNWTDSLLPGYPADNSPAGHASPLHGLTTSAGDPVQAWDNNGHVYYGGIAFNRTRPANGSIWVARYTWSIPATSPTYEFTTIVKRGTPSPLFRGIFNDKVGLEVDRGVNSPFAGNVYVCWARFTASGPNNGVWFTRSTNGGRSFENPQKISESIHGSQFCDIAVTRTGVVFVAWRQFDFKPNQGQRQADGVAWAKSTNGGVSFTKPAIAKPFIHWDLQDVTGSPEAAAEARHEACLAGDGTELEACGAETEEPSARDCGDGPFACLSGYVFFREDSQVRITADPTAAGNPNAAYVVYNATVPGTQTPTGTTYGTVVSGTGSQGSVYFIKTTNGGTTWSNPQRIDPQAKGHQFFPDIDANAGRLHAVYQDSRSDCASGPPSTPSGGDFRTVPISNRWVASNPPGGVSCGPGLESFYATSLNDGGTWSPQVVSSVAQMPQYEQFGNRDIPFFGDYNYISAVGSTVLMNWTDQRDTVPGTDPRYTNGDGTDGFDVHQCRTFNASTGTWSADTCPNAGGLNQNIYGFVFH